MKKGITAGCLLLVLLVLLSCREKYEMTVLPAEQEAVRAPVVKTVTCGKREYTRDFSTFGSVAYVSKADVYPKSGEIIESLTFEEGDRVRRGDVLAELDRRKLEIQLRETAAGILTREAQLNLAVQRRDESRRNIEAQFHTIRNAELDLQKKEADFQRISTIAENKQQLFDAGGVTREELESVRLEYLEKETQLQQTAANLAIKRIGYRDEDLLEAGYGVPEDPEERKGLFVDLNTRLLQAEVEVAEAELNAARSRIETLELYLSETSVASPIDGVVARKYMEEGEKASPEKPLYLIFPTRQVYALAEVSEKDLLSLREGLEADVVIDAGGGSRTGRIDRISPWIQSESRTAPVRILLDNRDGLFRVGQFVRITVLLSDPVREVMVPSDAVLYDGEENPYVFTIRGGRIFRTDITCGEENDGFLPVLSGLEEGERIAAAPRESFRQGMEVRVE